MNHTSHLLSQIIHCLKSHKTKDSYVRPTDFVHEWKGWMGFLNLPVFNGVLEQQDISDFHVAIVSSMGENLKNLFMIKMNKIIQSSIGHFTITKENLPLLPCGVESGSIESGIRQYFAKEKTQNNETITTTIDAFPKIFCVNANRIIHSQKSNQTITIPTWLDLREYSSETYEGCPFYCLRSICYHVGKEIYSGHWMTMKKVLGHWVLCDDRKIEVIGFTLNTQKRSTLMSLEDTIIRNASFFVYESISEDQFQFNGPMFSLTNNVYIPLHQEQVIMSSQETQNYVLVPHTEPVNSINIENNFPSLCG